MDWFQFSLDVSSKFLEHEWRRLNKLRDALIKNNDEIRKANNEKPAYGFIFDGNVYRMHNPPTFYSNLPAFEECLIGEVKQFTEDHNNIAEDQTKIRQITTLLLMPTASYQEARDALPDEIAEAHPETAQLSRVNPVEYSIFNERTMRQLRDLEDLIAFYSATRMIY